ncbi:uncharacterized protein LOC141708498 isoform X3 [Apium graveolens]|uniref:uncharacterized protein LOC141708498 isoform X3 n=1 Tax=Apium graveolens TaxID=4045 RepID=UPI003D7908BC
MKILSWVIVFLGLFPSGFSFVDDFDQAYPIVEPDPGHTKLRLARAGLEAIERITTPISAVAVIGPYRSGKSFLLNQLLSLSCNEGFGVGHMRDTKTKGIWVWGKPIEVDINGVKTSAFFLDTEGFESIGKSNVYDDRIFALATVLSSVLIYNLPETIREADISRLSFAIELAEEFYGRCALQKLNGEGNLKPYKYYTLVCIFIICFSAYMFLNRWILQGQDVAFEPAKLLWLIQRDFLQGKSVKEMVDEALKHVPNSDGDKYIDQINQIRDSLAVMGDNSTAFSLPQILEALNKGEIPSTGSLVEVFNKGILERCLKLYNERMEKVVLPVSVESLQGLHEASREVSMKAFDEQHFGRHHAKRSVEQLNEEIEKVHKNFIMSNEYNSAKLCEGLYTSCEDKMDQLQVLRLPSMAKFNAGFIQCNRSFEIDCVGPSKTSYEIRMRKMLGKSKSLFIKEYNHRLYNWLVAFSLVMVVMGRFIIKFFLIEMGAWILFIFLETYTRMFWSAESLYYNPVWHFVVATWETLVYSPLLDVDRWSIPLCIIVSALVIYWRCYGRRKPCPQWLLPLHNIAKDQRRSE